MYSLLWLALLQQPATAPVFPVAQVEITPATAAVEVGQKVQLSARALDAAGRPIPAAAVRWFVASDVGSVDSSGLVTGGYSGVVRVAAVATLPGQQGQKIEFALIHVLPESPARIVVEPAPTQVMAGTQVTLVGTAYSRHGDRRPTWSRSRPATPAWRRSQPMAACTRCSPAARR